MGGYAIDDSDTDQKFMPEYKPRTVLDIDSLNWLIDNDICILPDFSERPIAIKAKPVD